MAVTENLRSLVGSLSELLEGHLKLFKLELADDAKVVGVEVGKIAALAPLLLVGYGFCCVALALFLKRFIAADLAFLLVGVVNLAAAAGGIFFAITRLKNRDYLAGTSREVEASTAVVAHTVKREQPNVG